MPDSACAGDTRLYQTIHGPRTCDQMAAELRAVGWPGPIPGTEGPGAVATAYQRTAGGAVTLLQGPDPSGGAPKAPNYSPLPPSQTQTQQQRPGDGAGFTGITRLLAADSIVKGIPNWVFLAGGYLLLKGRR